MSRHLVEQHAREKSGLGPDWAVFLWEQLPEAKGMLLTGAITPPPYKSGPHKGTPRWKARDVSTEKRIFIAHADQDAYNAAWEASTGNCSRCFGKGDLPWGWSRAEGPKRKPCVKCKGSGKAIIAKGA